jgi:hypothetical protein
MNDTKNPLKSLGIMGPLVSLIVWGLNKWKPGLGLDEGTVSTVIDQGAILVGTVTAIWGRWRANTEIKA